MINNLDLIKPRLEEIFSLGNSDLFFHLEVIQRKKENPHVTKGSNVVKSYAVKDVDYLEKKLENEIIPICNTLNARAMIDLNPKSFRKVTHSMLRKLSTYIESEMYDSYITKLFTSCTDSTPLNKSYIGKCWMVDIDTKDMGTYNEVLSMPEIQSKMILPSKNGVHIITKPFDSRTFNPLNDVEIKKYCLTNLFIP